MKIFIEENPKNISRNFHFIDNFLSFTSYFINIFTFFSCKLWLHLEIDSLTKPKNKNKITKKKSKKHCTHTHNFLLTFKMQFSFCFATFKRNNILYYIIEINLKKMIKSWKHIYPSSKLLAKPKKKFTKHIY